MIAAPLTTGRGVDLADATNHAEDIAGRSWP